MSLSSIMSYIMIPKTPTTNASSLIARSGQLVFTSRHARVQRRPPEIRDNGGRRYSPRISCILSSTLCSHSDRRAARRPNQGVLTHTTLPLQLATSMQDIHVESRKGFSYLMLVNSMVINYMNTDITYCGGILDLSRLAIGVFTKS